MKDREDLREDTPQSKLPHQDDFDATPRPPIAAGEEAPSEHAETEEEFGEDVDDDAGGIEVGDLLADPNGLLGGEVSHNPNRPRPAPYPAGGKTQNEQDWL